jgi:hypothetical protein
MDPDLRYIGQARSFALFAAGIIGSGSDVCYLGSVRSANDDAA